MSYLRIFCYWFIRAIGFSILMIWLLKYWKGLILVALIAGAGLTGYLNGRDAIQRKWDVDTAREVKAQLVKNQEDAAKLKKLEETKNANLVEIDRLRANNHSLWLRLPRTPCTGDPPGSDTVARGGEFPTETETAFQRFRTGLADEAYRADKMTEDCRVLNEFVR